MRLFCQFRFYYGHVTEMVYSCCSLRSPSGGRIFRGLWSCGEFDWQRGHGRTQSGQISHNIRTQQLCRIFQAEFIVPLPYSSTIPLRYPIGVRHRYRCDGEWRGTYCSVSFFAPAYVSRCSIEIYIYIWQFWFNFEMKMYDATLCWQGSNGSCRDEQFRVLMDGTEDLANRGNFFCGTGRVTRVTRMSSMTFGRWCLPASVVVR